MGENTRMIQLHFYVTEKENEIIKERMKQTEIQDQKKSDIAMDKLSVKEYEDPFSK